MIKKKTVKRSVNAFTFIYFYYFVLLTSFICMCLQTNAIENELHYVYILSQTLILINSVLLMLVS